MDIGLSSLGAFLLSIVNGWIYSITCNYMLFYVIIVFILSYTLDRDFRCSRANCCINIVEFVSIITSLNVLAM